MRQRQALPRASQMLGPPACPPRPIKALDVGAVQGPDTAVRMRLHVPPVPRRRQRRGPVGVAVAGRSGGWRAARLCGLPSVWKVPPHCYT